MAYNVPTAPRNILKDAKTTVATLNAIAACSHLTPATEAEMDNLLGQDRGMDGTRRSVPLVSATIEDNEPKDEAPFSFGKPVATKEELAALDADFPDPDCETPSEEAYEAVA